MENELIERFEDLLDAYIEASQGLASLKAREGAPLVERDDERSQALTERKRNASKGLLELLVPSKAEGTENKPEKRGINVYADLAASASDSRIAKELKTKPGVIRDLRKPR